MKEKKLWLALLLTLLFGPLGLLYVAKSWLTAVAFGGVYLFFKAILPWETFVNIVFWHTIPTLFALALFLSSTGENEEKQIEPRPEPEPQPEPLPEPTEKKVINGRTYAKINDQWFEQ